MTNILILNEGDKPVLSLVARARIVLRKTESGFLIEKHRNPNSKLPCRTISFKELGDFIVKESYHNGRSGVSSITFPERKLHK